MLAHVPSLLARSFLLATAAHASDPGDERAQRLEWLRAHSFPLATVEAGSGFEDLEPLRELVGDARIVSLGESTHGSREQFQCKHRLLEYLVSELGFSTFSIEASSPEAFAVGDWVRGGQGDPHLLIEGMYFWTWHTEEVLAMVEWMRRHNLGPGKQTGTRIDFTGFDMQTPDVASAIVLGLLERADPDWAPRARALYADVSEARGSGAGFGVATGTFPVEAARGRTVVFSADIRTELNEGYAGLWWRADVPGKGPAFDNMNATGPRGTTGWQRHRIELEVPEATTNINFGLLMPGKGTAWFDDLRIELDGEPWLAPEQFGLDFEEQQPLGLYTPPGSYRVRITDDDATSGRQCLEMAWVAPEAPSAEDAVEGAREVLAHLEARREAYAEELHASDVDWALQNARIVLQCLQQRAGDRTQTRDRSMADNVAWLAEQRPDERLVLWAHNGHVARKRGWMGSHLDERFGDEQLVVGFATSAGEYHAIGAGGSEERVHALATPPEDSLESLLAELDEPFLVVDLREAQPGSDESGWLHEPLPFRSIGAMEMDQQFFPAVLAREYDLIVYVRDTTAARQLPWKRAR